MIRPAEDGLPPYDQLRDLHRTTICLPPPVKALKLLLKKSTLPLLSLFPHIRSLSISQVHRDRSGYSIYGTIPSVLSSDSNFPASARPK